MLELVNQCIDEGSQIEDTHHMSTSKDLEIQKNITPNFILQRCRSLIFGISVLIFGVVLYVLVFFLLSVPCDFERENQLWYHRTNHQKNFNDAFARGHKGIEVDVYFTTYNGFEIWHDEGEQWSPVGHMNFSTFLDTVVGTYFDKIWLDLKTKTTDWEMYQQLNATIANSNFNGTIYVETMHMDVVDMLDRNNLHWNFESMFWLRMSKFEVDCISWIRDGLKIPMSKFEITCMFWFRGHDNYIWSLFKQGVTNLFVESLEECIALNNVLLNKNMNEKVNVKLFMKGTNILQDVIEFMEKCDLYVILTQTLIQAEVDEISCTDLPSGNYNCTYNQLYDEI